MLHYNYVIASSFFFFREKINFKSNVIQNNIHKCIDTSMCIVYHIYIMRIRARVYVYTRAHVFLLSHIILSF